MAKFLDKRTNAVRLLNAATGLKMQSLVRLARQRKGQRITASYKRLHATRAEHRLSRFVRIAH
jgi:hypothetical protein